MHFSAAAGKCSVLDSMFEANGELGIDIIVNGGAMPMVRLSGNCLEGLAGPSIIAKKY